MDKLRKALPSLGKEEGGNSPRKNSDLPVLCCHEERAGKEKERRKKKDGRKGAAGILWSIQEPNKQANGRGNVGEQAGTLKSHTRG